jgi:hypothetical protein
MSKTTMRTGVWLLSGAALSLICSTGCGLSAEAQYKRKLAETGTPAMHAVENNRLRELMGNMNQLRDESDYGRPLELQQDRDRCEKVAKSLADSAGKLPELAPMLQLDAAETKSYLVLAAKLRQQALHTGELAQRGTFAELNRSTDEMIATCNACHSLFRGPRVPVAPPATGK